ncbi:MAG: class I SAM-dependent methyltransferase [Blastocatellia bacterium]
MTAIVREDYNERLFSGNWRSRIHLSRFYWLAAKMRGLNLNRVSIIELGCYDGKTLGFLDAVPERYLGLDANWEGGLDSGKVAWENFPNIELRHCRKPEEIPTPQKAFDVGVCMETLEHVPPDLVEPYLQKLSQVIEGHLFITVPIERGLIFLLKHGLKKVFGMKDEKFHTMEFINCILGRMNKVRRREHKGFDDRLLVRQVEKYFDIVRVSGVFPGLGILSLNLTIGIIAKTKGYKN